MRETENQMENQGESSEKETTKHRSESELIKMSAELWKERKGKMTKPQIDFTQNPSSNTQNRLNVLVVTTSDYG